MRLVPFALMFFAAGLIQAAANDLGPLPLGTPTATASAGEEQSPPAHSAAKPYVARGMTDLALSAFLNIPHSGLGSTSGQISIAAGRYVCGNSLVGGAFLVSAGSGPPGSGYQTYSLSAHYRFLFHTRNPKVFPFLGVTPGLYITHAWSYTGTPFTITGEAGVKCFIARNVSLEPAYRIGYIQAASLTLGPSSTVSSFNVGLAFTF